MIITLLQRQLYYKTSNKVEVARPELFLCKIFFSKTCPCIILMPLLKKNCKNLNLLIAL